MLDVQLPGTIVTDATVRQVRGAPAPSGPVELVLRMEGQPRPVVLRVTRPIGLLGRMAGVAYRLRAPSVSRIHAQLEYVDGALVVSDLGSASGTFVDDHRIASPTPLTTARTVRFGGVSFDVGPVPTVEPAPREQERRREDNPLTPRQHEVLVGMADGLTNVLIAERLGVAPRTVKAYAAEIYDRLDRRSRAGAVAVGHRLGLLDDRD